MVWNFGLVTGLPDPVGESAVFHGLLPLRVGTYQRATCPLINGGPLWPDVARNRATFRLEGWSLMPIVNPNTAAIDVHSDNHVVCVPADRDTANVRTFGANFCDLLQIAAWLKYYGIATVAIEGLVQFGLFLGNSA